MRVGFDRVNYRQILAVAFASILLFALYTPISAPFPSVMTFRMVEALSGVAIVVSDETTCQQIVLDNNSTATWSEEDGFVCTIGSDLTLDSDSSIRVSDGITLTIASGITLTNAGEVTIASGGTLDNQGTMENAGTVANIGMLTNNGAITVYLDGDLENNAGTFTNNHIIIVNGTFTNIGGNITNAATGTITVNSSTTGLLNQGVFINNGTINNNGQIDNDNSFTNNGSIFNNCDSTFNGDLEEGSNPPIDACSEDDVGSISGFVFDDVNGNGIMDEEEVGFDEDSAQICVEELANGDNEDIDFSACDAIDSNGLFELQIQPGRYVIYVEEFTKEDFYPTNENWARTIISPGEEFEVNFGYKYLGSGTVSGTVFIDTNGDGDQDGDEPGQPEVSVYVVHANGFYLGSTTTDEDGSFTLTGVPGGNLTVFQIVPEGYVTTFPEDGLIEITLAVNGTVNGLLFGNVAADTSGSGFVTGFVFDDANGNGIMDEGEGGISNMEVCFSNESEGFVFEDCMRSESDGSFAFEVPVGTIKIFLNMPFDITTEDNLYHFVEEGEMEQVNIGLDDFEFATVTGTVFNDEDEDGFMDYGELGIGGIEVCAEDSWFEEWTCTVSGKEGSYTLNYLLPFQYHIFVSPPEDFFVVTGDFSIDLLSGEVFDADFGISLDSAEHAIVYGFKFADEDKNGKWDEGEPGMGGIEITACWDDEFGGDCQEYETNPDGTYTLTVPPYTTIFVRELGGSPTTPEGGEFEIEEGLEPGESFELLFGNAPPGMLTIIVFNDKNGDGTKDEGEVGLGGVWVQLHDDGTAGDIFDEEELTDEDGSVTFIVPPDMGLHSHIYLSYNYIPTFDEEEVFALSSGESLVLERGFLNLGSGSISGTVFIDENGNGVMDGDEQGHEGVIVSLQHVDDIYYDSIATDGDGTFSFDGVPGGEIIVYQIVPTGYVPTKPEDGVHRINLDLDQDFTGVIFGNNATETEGHFGTITGIVFNDENENGVQDDGEEAEEGIEGIEVCAYDMTHEDGVDCTDTDSDGQFTFSDVPVASIIVYLDGLPLFRSTTDDFVIVFVEDEEIQPVAFGLVEIEPATITGFKFEDLDGDGQWDDGEEGMGGVEICVNHFYFNYFDCVITDEDGRFTFENVPPGWVDIEEEYLIPVGYIPTTPEYGEIETFLSEGEVFEINFGNMPFEPATITGFKFEDLDGDGQWDDGEEGMGGVEICVNHFYFNYFDCVITDEDGRFTFENVPPGEMGIFEVDLEGYYVHTTPDDGFTEVSLSEGQSFQINFGNMPFEPATITGIVYHDQDGSQTQDVGEEGIGGIEVCAFSLDFEFAECTVTGEDGLFTLTGLPPGDYDLNAYEAGSYTPTTPDSIGIEDLSQGEVRGGFEFGFDLADEPEFAIIYGFKFVDENANGVWENDERGMGRVEIEACWEEEFSDCDYYITNSDGSYTLTVPTNTAITLSEESDGTFEPTTPPGGLVEYESVSGSEPLMVIFGNAPVDAYGTVFGTKFFDENGNGVKDPDEDGMPGVTIRVTADAYTGFTDSTEEGGPEFEFKDISETGTEILSNIDDATEEIPIGFEFNFYGKSYESAVVDTNGKLFFEGAVSAYSNEPLDETNLVRFVAPFWDDLVTDMDESDAIYYQTVGSAPNRMLIVQWNAYHIASSKSPISFQVVLFEGTNEILFNYLDVDTGDGRFDNGASATVGIKGPGIMWLQYSYDSPSLADGLAIRFNPGEVVISSAVTGDSGEYEIANIPARMDIKILEQVPEGYVQTAPKDFEEDENGVSATGGSYFLTLSPGLEINYLDFGNEPIEGGGSGGSSSSIGGSRGGGGGGRTTVLTWPPIATKPDSYFEDHPLEKILVSNSGLFNSSGASISQVQVGQQITISGTFGNQQQKSQTYAFIIQITDEDGFVIDLMWQVGTLGAGSSTEVSNSWTPQAPGTYTITIFVWDGISSTPTALSEVGVMQIEVG